MAIWDSPIGISPRKVNPINLMAIASMLGKVHGWETVFSDTHGGNNRVSIRNQYSSNGRRETCMLTNYPFLRSSRRYLSAMLLASVTVVSGPTLAQRYEL